MAPALQGKVVVIFGHGTFQNAVESLLRTFGDAKQPPEIFARAKGASHLRRGFPHNVYPTKQADRARGVRA